MTTSPESPDQNDQGLYYTPPGQRERVIHGPASKEECRRVMRARLANAAFAAGENEFPQDDPRYEVKDYTKPKSRKVS